MNFAVVEAALIEAKEYIKNNNPAQASEKIYKVAEECIKYLAEKYKIKEYDEAKEEGRWHTYLLGKAATKLYTITNERKIRDAWNAAYDLHIWGFHELKYGIEIVKGELPLIEWLFNYTKNASFV